MSDPQAAHLEKEQIVDLAKVLPPWIRVLAWECMKVNVPYGVVSRISNDRNRTVKGPGPSNEHARVVVVVRMSHRNRVSVHIPKVRKAIAEPEVGKVRINEN